MKSSHLSIIWAALILLSCLPLCSTIAQRQIQSRNHRSSSEKPNPAMTLPDGREIQANVPANSNTPAIFYYRIDSPGHRQPLVVTVRCPGREIIIYARRRPIIIQYRFDEKNLNEEIADFSSLENQNNLAGVAFVSAPPLADPVETTVIISVYFKEIPKESNNMTTTFTIIGSSFITHLFAGDLYSGSIAKDHYAYFLVPIMRSECTLLISLTNLDNEGDAGLVLSYGSKTRPTVSDHQFTSISDSKAHTIEINNNDIYPSTSMSGNLVIGVYGKTASSFSLAVAYQDQKMITLTSGDPVEMLLNEASSANFKFSQQSKTDLQVMLTKLSGELHFYMTCLNSTENLVYNLPDSTNYKWQISHSEFQSFLNIPIQDPQACASSVYLIHLEAISSSSFRLMVNGGRSFARLQDGVSYSGPLRPQEFIPFEFTTSNDTEEAQLSIKIDGRELKILISHDQEISPTNYLWKETIISDAKTHILSLKTSPKEENSRRNIFSILFYNPTNTVLSYNFAMKIKSSKTFFLNGMGQTVDINPNEKISFIFYSNLVNVDKIPLAISSSAPDLKEGSTARKSVEAALSQGRIIEARYWAEEEAPGPGQEISLERVVPEVKFSYQDSYLSSRGSQDTNVVQTLSINKASMGKYVIEVANPWEFTVTFAIAARISRHVLQLSGENLQYKDGIYSKDRNYEIFMTKTQAKWYY